MLIDVMMPGTNHLPGSYEWAHRLSPDDYHRVLQAVDSCGFHAILVSEHLAMPYFEVPRLGAYWHDALTTMAFIAGATRRVNIDACVLVMPYHHPLRFAKAIGTMEVLSGGRMLISVGVGHAEQEFAALNVSFEDRGRITDESLDALLTLWTTDEPEHHGEFFEISGLAIAPRPARHIPIAIGGNSRPALRRAARYDGWQPNPMNMTIAELPAKMAYIREQLAFSGKEDTFEVNWLNGPTGAALPDGFTRASPGVLRSYRDRLIEAYVTTYADAGVTRTALQSPESIGTVDEFIAFLEWFDAEVVMAVR